MLPDSEVASALEPVLPRVRRCVRRRPGSVVLEMHVAPGGEVTGTTIGGIDTEAQRACIATAIQGVTFPASTLEARIARATVAAPARAAGGSPSPRGRSRVRGEVSEDEFE